ncbi:MAG: hypothetical protein A3E80_03045 [Chlamydiae bacterium RIFCSPHIGHO2_12_FULL_49_9]|nr:MAG: hypothetical protein A3E80_03045 [Chlamydiae bacterium RIFCSPHIGHO2_12_FULL_49_9]
MLELSQARKNKVNLADYNCAQDIENRMLMSDFSALDVEILEEILFSPLKISFKKLAKTIDCTEDALKATLTKLSKTGLLSLEADSILVDKEKRKYFEFQITRFDSAFKPDMEFLQGILKKVPIQTLPTWYSIPRSSNNIFESLVEKYLLTPQIFQRYLMELSFADPIATSIVSDLFASSDFKISSSDLISKYNLTRKHFEEILLLLEFNFVCCLTYEKEDDHWLEFVTPFHEWHEYLRFLKTTEAPRIPPTETIHRYRDSDFAFVEDMGAILKATKKTPLSLSNWQGEDTLPSTLIRDLAPFCALPLETQEEFLFAGRYLAQVIDKLCLIKLADRIDGRLYALETANDWLDLASDKRALFLYRHSLNRILAKSLPGHIATERNIREAEKAIRRALHGEWVYWDDFLRGILVPLNEDSVVMLKRTGKHWKYSLPSYGDDEKALFKATFFEWLFELGMVAPGSCQGKDCFSVTSFGRFFFEE